MSDNIQGFIDNVRVSRQAVYNKTRYKCSVKFLNLIEIKKYSGYEFSSLKDAIRSNEYILNRVPKWLRVFCTIKWASITSVINSI
jgi:hypothetical protein